MEDIRECYNAWKITIEMIKDRGYNFPEATDYEKVDFEAFKTLFVENNCDMMAIKPDRKIYVKFVLTPKIRPLILREYFDDILSNYISKTDEFIVLLRTPINTPIEKLNREAKYRHIQIFWTHILQYNPTKHYLVPRHEKCNNEQVKELLDKYKDKKMFPVILRDDPIARYYNFQPGDIICVKRRMNDHYLHVV